MEYRIDKSGIVWNKEQYIREKQTININFTLDQILIMWNNMMIVSVDSYDSSSSTLEHIRQVNEFLIESSKEILMRAIKHDATKLTGIEKDIFDKWTPILAKIEYGTDEYKESLNKIKPALDNHYKYNSHHPEYYQNGVDDMDLFDIIEMLNDWKAATLRTKLGDIKKSVALNQKRFKISEQLYNILINTINKYNWLSK
jgi:hypothetical protein